VKFIWSSSFETGNTGIDEEHKKLFDMGNDFFDKIEENNNKETHVESLNFLVQYVKEHFMHERLLMKKIRYPLFETHKKDHEALVRRLVKIYQSLIDKGFSENLSNEITAFIQEWFVNHINIYDKKLAEFVKKHVK